MDINKEVVGSRGDVPSPDHTQLMTRPGEIRADVEIGHMADLLAEVHLAYTNRVVTEDAPLEGVLSKGVLDCILTGVLADTGRNAAAR